MAREHVIDRDRRFPARVYGEGQEPDPRFSLANERTFLAWMRTSLAFIAGGVALAALDLEFPRGVQIIAAGVLLAVGLSAPLLAWNHWGAVEVAMRREEPLPSFRMMLLTSVALAVAGFALLVGIVAGL